MKIKAILLVIIAALCACTPIDDRHRNVFEFWWKEMDCKYPFFIQKNIDWDSIFVAYKERAQSPEAGELEIVFQEVVDYLRDGHCCINTGDKTIRYRLPTDTIDKFAYYDIAQYTATPLKRLYNRDSTLYAVQFKDNITYIHYGSFNFPIIDIDEVINIINRFSYAGGMIIDIRGNRGGQTQNIGELLSLFFSGQRLSGTIGIKLVAGTVILPISFRNEHVGEG